MIDKDKILALWADVLERWECADEMVIYDRSCRISDDLAELKQDIEQLDIEFKKALGL